MAESEAPRIPESLLLARLLLHVVEMPVSPWPSNLLARSWRLDMGTCDLRYQRGGRWQNPSARARRKNPAVERNPGSHRSD